MQPLLPCVLKRKCLSLTRWNADGSLAGFVGKHSHREPFSAEKPGEYHDPKSILGVAHDCVVVADRYA